MKPNKNQTVLILAPHTDDAEFGMGGTTSKLCRDGNTVYQVNFSTAHDCSLHGTRNLQLEYEVKKSSKSLGIIPENLFIHDFKVREFANDRQNILDLILYYKKKLKPDIIFIPSSNDIHQDHKTIYEESLRAFKFETIFAYELIWNLFTSNYQMFVHLDYYSAVIKQYAVSCFKSQHNRNYCNGDKIMAQLITRGMQCNSDYAEVFEVIRINQKL